SPWQRCLWHRYCETTPRQPVPFPRASPGGALRRTGNERRRAGAFERPNPVAARRRQRARRPPGQRPDSKESRMDHHTDLIDIVAIGLALAFVFGFVANKLKLSPLVGYLLAGIVVGPYTPGFVGDAGIATQLAEIGVMLLMFGVGLHFSLEDLMKVKWIAIPGAVVQIAVATLLGWALAWLIGWSTIEGVMFGFCLATASTVVLLRAMEERRL